ncbi:hypothetical protein HS088_TW21G00448 [Tripterygium wilfordii]|uniref:Protein GRIM REAPER-like n=1 Tax=Tripterygium wilfordii TaxID=458696 RepID=A0A7J7C2H4_TRIWF|nr:protein GRIM REAPER [Tripterygium wilfordii]KAF5728301.1 hypothetical protein HS088_TW21G00448 [Tripterygium wilfordii]
MATCVLKLTTILSLVLLIIIIFHSQSSISADIEEEDGDDYYILDSPVPQFRSRSRFLASIIKKGTHCNPITKNICNGISANNGTSLLYCCKKHCRNILGDRNNCGRCRNKCGFGERCCQGKCTKVLRNVGHCGKCNKKCSPGIKCENGYCGYA